MDIRRALGVGLLGFVAGCTALKDEDPKLLRYNTDNDFMISSPEAKLFLDKEFEGVSSDEETLKALDFISTVKDKSSRENLLNVLVEIRKARKH